MRNLILGMKFEEKRNEERNRGRERKRDLWWNGYDCDV